MGEITGIFAATHAPPLVRDWETIEGGRKRGLANAFAELGKRIIASRPDVIVAIGADHWANFFLDNVPAICIGVGEEHGGPPETWLADYPHTRMVGKPETQQLARVGHDVIVFEKADRIGGLLRYGIPDFKMEKSHIDRRVAQMEAEGVQFRVNQNSGVDTPANALLEDFDAVVLSGGAEWPRDLPVKGRELAGIHFAMDFLPLQNKVVAGDTVAAQLTATDKHVVVIGGGDTGSDCVGTSNRHGAKSIAQFELMPQPPAEENKPMVWPNWPIKLRTSSSHEEGCDRDWAVATKEFVGNNGKVEKLKAVRVEWRDGKMQEVPGSEFEMRADLVLLAVGFMGPEGKGLLEEFGVLGVTRDQRSNVKASVDDTDKALAYQTANPKVFAAGDMRRGQSLVVWAIREGRQCARSVDAFLMGSSELPR